jgi:hypothetical protein
MTFNDLGDTDQPIDPMLIKAVETAFLAFSVPAVTFVPLPQAWKRPAGPVKASAQRKLRIKLELIKRDGFRCAYCAREFVDLDDATLDHVIPNCTVGHWQTWNLVLACGPCNNAKGDRIPLVLAPLLLHLVHTLSALAERQRKSNQPIPTDGYPSRSAAKRASKRVRKARAMVRRQIEALSGVPFRLALEAAPQPAGGETR